MTLRLGWFAEDFKLLSSFKQLILSKVSEKLTTVKELDPIRSGVYSIEEEEGPYRWMRIILPHGLSTGYQLIGTCILILIITHMLLYVDMKTFNYPSLFVRDCYF